MFCNRLLTTMTVSVFVALAAAGCVCPSGGATTSSRSASGTLTPGELRIVDVETPGNTTQVNVRVSWVPGLAVWPVASSCPDQDVETCVTSTEKEPLPPPPAGVTKIGMMFEPVGAMLRVVIKNTTEDAVTFSVTVTPWRAGCT